MLRKLIQNVAMALLMLTTIIGIAFAQVDVNNADQAALENVKGIGPSTSMKILDARKKDGPFKSWSDLAQRVKGIGEKTSIKLSDAGLTVNGQSLANAGVVPAFAGKNKVTGVGEGMEKGARRKSGMGVEKKANKEVDMEAGRQLSKQPITGRSAEPTKEARRGAVNPTGTTTTSPPITAKSVPRSMLPASSLPLFPSTPSSTGRSQTSIPAK